MHQKNRIAFRTYISFAAVIFSLSACGKYQADSSIKSVDIPQSSVKDQGDIGFCWAYSTTGFLESLALKKQATPLDLSEEALGFYRMANELLAMSNKFTPEELATAADVEQKSFEGLEGWDLLFTKTYHPNFRAPGSLELVRQKGVVPESAWSFKFTSEQQRQTFFTHVFTSFAELLKEKGQGNISMKMIEDILAAPQAFGSIPPDSFTIIMPDYSKKTYTPTEFAADFIAFSPDEYTYLEADAQIGYNELVVAIKKTLAQGIDVPFGFSVFATQPNPWTGAFDGDELNPSNIENVGGHAVLVTDFVNKGGRPGKIAPLALQQEVERPSADLDFLIIKNSWGTKNASPMVPLAGYNTLNQTYLKTALPQSMSIVVPRKIAMEIRYGN